MMEVLEHKHSLDLIDLLPTYPRYEEEYEDEDDDDDLTRKQNFICTCDRCGEEINLFHRYYYKCTNSCNYFVHKFCAKIPATLKHISHDAHTLVLTKMKMWWSCDICERPHRPQHISYSCSTCDFDVDVNCVTAMVKKRFYHPSHPHPLVPSSQMILCMCDACGKEHKGNFYQCPTCPAFFIHNDCLFLPKKLLIQQITNNVFFHTHPLTLTYSFPIKDQTAKHNPSCRICDCRFYEVNLWIYKCEKCWYYTHLDCATSRGEPFMSIFLSSRMGKTVKNFDDIDHPNLLRLPFLDRTYSILKHIFSNGSGYESLKHDEGNLKHVNHQHPLILVHTQRNDTARSISSRTNVISCHILMKNIDLVCNACMRRITNIPFYMCNDENQYCNFVLHEWCTQLPAKVKDHPCHPQHELVLLPVVPRNLFGVFTCRVCSLPCNGFVYSCRLCDYHIDVNCAFIPKKVTHEAHPNHLLWRVKARSSKGYCVACLYYFDDEELSFSCRPCDFDIHPWCALLLPRTVSHKYDKHSMDLSYFPIENHKSEYFCEICEEELDPQTWFYHCTECDQSMHSSCAPLLVNETAATWYYDQNVYRFVNIKFGGIINIEGHQHKNSLSFVQGIESDGKCTKCAKELQYRMIFKCLLCNFAVHLRCCK